MDLIKKLYEYSKDLDILFVEDDPDLRLQMRDMFHELFMSVDTADNGELGLLQYKKRLDANHKPYDFVITDINMPIMNGIEMIHAIYEINPAQSIIVVSAHNQSDYLMELINLGINSFLIKPVRHKELMTTLHKAAKAIVNERLVKEHYSEIEELNARLSTKSEELKKSNEQMHEKNIALEKSMRIIEGLHHKDTLHRQINTSTKLSKDPDTKEESLDESIDHSQSYLHKIEEIISNIAQNAPYKKIDDTSLLELSTAVKSYSATLSTEKSFISLTSALEELGTTLAYRPQSGSPEEMNRTLNMLESFFFIYTKWQHEWKNIDSDVFEVFSDSITKEIHVLIDLWNGKI